MEDPGEAQMGRDFRLSCKAQQIQAASLNNVWGALEMTSEILKPVAVLIVWSLVMLIWLVIVRLPAMKKVGIDINKAVGGRPGQLDGVVADKAQWPAHNYIHLMEQPTLFYAVALLLATTGMGNGLNAMIAWGYVVLRIAHSLLQATTNIIRYRFALFALSSLCLFALALHALIGVFAMHA
jgi:hypothetical protein